MATILDGRDRQKTDNASVAITDVPGIRVGHWTDAEARTGCTVVLLPDEGAVASVDVRGPAPGTRETDLLQLGRLVERVHAICLCGGSAFGPEEGYAACLAATEGPPAEGRVGAGTGATVGKLLGPDRAHPGGVGTASVRLPSGAVVAALAVANAVGDVHGRDGRLLAGVDGWRTLLDTGQVRPPPAGANTTIAVVATDARLDKAGCRRLAEAGQDGLALAVRPAHTLYDGDAVFAVSAGEAEADPISLGTAAAEAMWRAIERAVTIA